ncbi:MAG: hypothetical protein LZF60_80153 [Nitrospira sp.]|nr:MAG: hypothetical protein LZF60_80153 [Nitrospira sp.]
MSILWRIGFISIWIVGLASCSGGPSDRFSRPPLSFKQEQEMDAVARHTKEIESDRTGEPYAAFYERGKSQRSLGRYKEAIADLKEAIRLNPEFADAYAELFNCYESTRQLFDARVALGWSKYYRQQYDQAIMTFGMAIQMNSRVAEPWWGRARSTIRKSRNPKDALDDLNKAIELDGRLTAAYLERGKIHRTSGRLELALADFETFMRATPDHVGGLFQRGAVQAALGHRAEALTDLDRVLASQPLHEDALIRRASVHFENGNHEAAWRDADTVRRMGAGNPEGLILLGRLSYLKENFIEAVSFYDRAVRTSPGFSQAAIKVYDGIVERAPRLGAAYHARGVAYYQDKRLESAIKDLSLALELMGDQPQAFYDRGVAYLRSGRFQEAAADFERALKHREQFDTTILSDPGQFVSGSGHDRLLGHQFGAAHPSVFINLSWTYYFLGRYGQARAAIGRGLQQYDDADANYLAGLITARLGDMANAVHLVERAARIEPHNSLYAETLTKLTKERDRAAIESWLGEMVTLGAIGLIGAGYNDYLCDLDEDCSWRRSKERERKQGR